MNSIEQDRKAVINGLPKGLARDILLTIFEKQGTFACVAGEYFYRLFVMTPDAQLVPCGGAHKYPRGEDYRRFITNNPMLGYICSASREVRKYLARRRIRFNPDLFKQKP